MSPDKTTPLQAEQAMPGCTCEACVPLTMAAMRMVLCSQCGNKRCPHATNHRNPCTGSNEPGQPGSSWEHVKPATASGGAGAQTQSRPRAE